MMEEYPIQDNDIEMMIGKEDQGPLPLDMPQVDFLGNDGGLFGNEAGDQSTGVNIVKKAQNKKQVQAIRQAMMKHDKKIQRQAVNAARANVNQDDDDDIVRNMTNLILHKNDDSVKPWQKGLMALDTATNSCVTNVVRSNFGNLKQSKKQALLSNTGKEASLLLNPVMESFLSFNINQNTTLLQTTNANVTAHFNQPNNNTTMNFLDQSLFNQDFDAGMNHQDGAGDFNFVEASAIQGIQSPPVVASANQSKMKSPLALNLGQQVDAQVRRSQALYAKIHASEVKEFTLDHLISSLRLDDEPQNSTTVKELAAKRFMDLMHLNSTSQVSL